MSESRADVAISNIEFVRETYFMGAKACCDTCVANAEHVWDEVLASIERAAAARELEEAANEINLKKHIGAGLECANAETTSGIWLRARAAEIREGKRDAAL